MTEKKTDYIHRQINILPQALKRLNVRLAHRDLKKNEFTKQMLQHFKDNQSEIHSREDWVYPYSIPKTVEHKVFQMKFTADMIETLEELVKEAKENFPAEGETLSQRRVLKAMFDEYLDVV